MSEPHHTRRILTFVDRNVSAVISAPCERLGEIIGDLATYPAWLELVTAAAVDSAPDDPHPAWLITLQAKIGPFSRSKRLRMARTQFSSTPQGALAVFERAEVDGRDHSSWTMRISVAPLAQESVSTSGSASEVTIDLAYGGSLWSGALEAVLASVVESAGARLGDYAS